MKPIKILAEKYEQIINPSVESIVEHTSADELLACFAKHTQLHESSVALMGYVNLKISQNKSIVNESIEKDEDVKLAVLAAEKVLKHFRTTNNKNYVIALEMFLQGPAESKFISESVVVEAGLMSKIGTGIGKAVGHVAHGVGATAGGLAGAWQAAKTGYQKGYGTVGSVGSTGTSSVSGADTTPTPAPGTPPGPGTPPAPAPGTPPGPGTPPAPAPAPATKVGVGQINKIVQTLRARDLESIKKNIEQRLAQLAAKRAPAGAPAAPAP